MQEKSYQIQDIDLNMKPITIAQFKGFTELVGSIDTDELKGFGDMVSTIIDQKLPEFMAIAFPDQGADKIDWTTVEFDKVDEIIDDFLLLNPRLAMRFGGLISILMPKLAKLMA